MEIVEFVRYFMKLSVEYCRVVEINFTFAEVIACN